MMRALILAPFAAERLRSLGDSLEIHYESWLDTRRICDPEELGVRIRDEDIAVLVIEADFVFEETFEAAPNLRFVGICRGSTSHVDIDAATRHGVLVVNAPGRNAQAVAEHVLGLMLALARRTVAAHSYVKANRWQNPLEPYAEMRGVELAGRTMGIIGLGAIGNRLSKLALALDMRVLAHDPYLDTVQQNIRLVELDELMTASDFVSIHVPADASTAGLVGARLISLMKPTACLISASDASVIDQQAVVEVLRGGGIAGAAFDVFEANPISPQDPLLSMENVVLTPHLGGATHETIERHSRMMAEDICRFRRGLRPERLVNPEAWERHGR